VSEIQVSDCIDVEDLRERLRKMTDAELLRFGKDTVTCAARRPTCASGRWKRW
jgi:hypothetical protein